MLKVFYTYLDFQGSESPKQQRQISSNAGYDLLIKSAEKCGFKLLIDDIVRSKNGKPYDKNNSVFFSISHSDNFVCVAISDCEIGIDVQKIGDVNEKIIRRFLKSEPVSDLENTFMWTDYEAMGKYFGTGIPHTHLVTPDIKISRLVCDNFCLSVCHNATYNCVSAEFLKL